MQIYLCFTVAALLQAAYSEGLDCYTVNSFNCLYIKDQTALLPAPNPNDLFEILRKPAQLTGLSAQ